MSFEIVKFWLIVSGILFIGSLCIYLKSSSYGNMPFKSKARKKVFNSISLILAAVSGLSSFVLFWIFCTKWL